MFLQTMVTSLFTPNPHVELNKIIVSIILLGLLWIGIYQRDLKENYKFVFF